MLPTKKRFFVYLCMQKFKHCALDCLFCDNTILTSSRTSVNPHFIASLHNILARCELHLTYGHFPQFFKNIKQDFLNKNILDVVCDETIQGTPHPVIENGIYKV